MSKAKAKDNPTCDLVQYYQDLLVKHIRELHYFVARVSAYAEEPNRWPLSQQEQIDFIRTVIFQANKLKASEGWVTTAVKLAAEDLALAS